MIADPRRNGGTVLVVHDGGLETMNLLHKSQFSRVHRPIKLNLTDHRRGAICLRRIDVDAEEKWGSTFRYNCCFRQTADAIHCISSTSLFSFFLFFSRIFVKDFVPQKHPRIPRRKHRIERLQDKFLSPSLSRALRNRDRDTIARCIDPISRISPASALRG